MRISWIFIIGLLIFGISEIGDYIKDNKNELKQVVSDAKDIIRDDVIPNEVVDEKGRTNSVYCSEGQLVIMIDSEVYHVGKKDSWGDVKPKECKEGDY